MEIQEGTKNTLPQVNPFSVIEHSTTHRIKIWDFHLDLYNRTTGRIRILALVPKKPEPLENINFSVAWCSPEDVNQFSKVKSNKILVGRYLSHFVDKRPNNSCGTIKSLTSLKFFPIHAFNALSQVPNWVMEASDIVQRTSVIEVFFNDDLNKFELLDPEEILE